MPAIPTVLWAQRSDKLYITLDVQDVKDEKMDLSNVDGAGKLSFSGKRAESAGSPEQEYAMEQQLYGEIDVEASKVSITPRNVFMVIQKKEPHGFWPRLTKESGRHLTHIKTDWSKWVDEDEEDEKPEMDMSGYNFSGFGGGEDGGMGGMDMSKLAALQEQMKGMGGGEGGEGEDEDDSDNEELPDLQK
ncbi:HSP20-like chaperone [Dunaliella salina]|uniref:HSP20-like chaperone n=1 Tax=Dunaliella salina TaxID=3046 RepID=A0ABQ7G7I3_DUNSA|nr:HSP20-like chaperone [Dunaliella salina]|eukprot:KAF5830560.1 HSP20-like chaperone [Dunaliella salina]